MGVPDITPLSFEINPYIRPLATPKGDTRFLNLQEMLGPADAHGFGVLAANAVTPEMVNAVLDAAWVLDSPVILEPAESQVGYALPGAQYADKLERYMDLVETVVGDCVKATGRVVPVCLHLDHLQKDQALAYAARDAGFTSVELDFSKQPTGDRMEAVRLNIAKCAGIIPELHRYGMSVEVEEGEIGDAKIREAQSEAQIRAEVTKPEYAVALVRGTNPEAIAIFYGGGHGEFKTKPVLVYDAIADVRSGLREAGVDVPVVLHGGTGQTQEGFRTAVRNGARKFNYASRFFTLMENHINGTEAGSAIMQEMATAAEGAGKKGPRYVWSDFEPRLREEVGPDVFRAAQREMYEHTLWLMKDALGSEGMAQHYKMAFM